METGVRERVTGIVFAALALLVGLGEALGWFRASVAEGQRAGVGHGLMLGLLLAAALSLALLLGRYLVRAFDERIQALEKRLHQQTQELEDLTRSLRSMVDSVDQGFFMFGPDGVCLPLFSTACESLLEGTPGGKTLWEVLKIPAGQTLERLEMWRELLFDPMNEFEDIVGLGPQVYPHSQGRQISLSYRPVLNAEKSQVLGIVVVATDETEEREAKERAEREFAYAQALLRILRSRAKFSDFVRESKAAFIRIEEQLDSPTPDLDLLFRILHTFKSGASTFSLFDVSNVAHELETEMGNLKATRDPSQPVRIPPRLYQKMLMLDELLSAFLSTNRDVLGSFEQAQVRIVEVSSRELKDFAAYLKQHAPDPEISEKFALGFLREPIVSYFAYFESVLSLEAQRQQKEILPIQFKGGDLRIEGERYQQLFSSMIHVFRNIVAHGLESPRQRRENGKDGPGRVWVEFQRWVPEGQPPSASWLRIAVRDDGRGVDPTVIRKVLDEKGVKDHQSETDEQVIQRIFLAGLSTAASVTELSGRGVGLDAVQAAAQELGGSARVVSKLGEGATFIVEFPEG